MATATVSVALADHQDQQDIYGNCLLGLTAAECKMREVGPGTSVCGQTAANGSPHQPPKPPIESTFCDVQTALAVLGKISTCTPGTNSHSWDLASSSHLLQACLSREALTANKWAGQDVCAWAWSEHGPQAPKRLKALAREGIPAHLRPALWLRFSGGLARQLAHGPGYYDNLVHHPVLGR